MCMPAALDRYYTRDEVLAFPDDGNRYELVYGALLVSPSPVVSHQRVLGRGFNAIYVYLESTLSAEERGETYLDQTPMNSL